MNQHLLDPASAENSPVSTMPRRRLAKNVIALHAEERPAIVQPLRRGRYPSGVEKLFHYTRPRFYVGVVCVVRTPRNDDVPVRIFQIMENGNFAIEAITDHLITTSEGDVTKQAVTGDHQLVRTATIRGLYVH